MGSVLNLLKFAFRGRKFQISPNLKTRSVRKQIHEGLLHPKFKSKILRSIHFTPHKFVHWELRNECLESVTKTGGKVERKPVEKCDENRWRVLVGNVVLSKKFSCLGYFLGNR